MLKLVFFVILCVNLVHSDITFFRQNCQKKIDTSFNCIQYQWDYPSCVPWDTRNCKVTSQKKFCEVYICKVIFYLLTTQFLFLFESFILFLIKINILHFS